MASGAAVLEASERVIEKGRAAAAYVLETAPADVEFEWGRFVVAGTDRAIGIMELAAKLRESHPLPSEVPASLDVTHVFEEAPMAFPNGCHVCELEVDPETGSVEFKNYVAVNDFGVIVNPLLVGGQAHGGIAQGIGQALIERVAYTEDGQLLSGSFMDYGLPRAEDLPAFTLASREVPCTTNPLGAKGCGEAGCAGSLPAVMNALVDALRPLGVTHIDMPATPEVIWRAIHGG
jgi:carbon-monoxide dehydrogenase large subunit